MGDVQAVGPVLAEMAFAEGPDKVSIPVEHDDWLFSPGEDKNVVMRVDGHAGTFFEGHAVGQLGPILNEVVAEIANTEYLWHDVHLPLLVFSCGSWVPKQAENGPTHGSVAGIVILSVAESGVNGRGGAAPS